MARSTTAFHNGIALILDFDETLAPATFPRVLEFCGYEPDSFEEEHGQHRKAHCAAQAGLWQVETMDGGR